MISPFLRYTCDSKPLTEPRALTSAMNSSRRDGSTYSWWRMSLQRADQLRRATRSRRCAPAPDWHRDTGRRAWCGRCLRSRCRTGCGSDARLRAAPGSIPCASVMSWMMPSIATQLALHVVDAGAALPHPADVAAGVHDAVLAVEAACAACRPLVDLLAHPLAIVGMRDRLVRDALVEQQVAGVVAGEARTAFADELHGPVRIVAAAIHHAVEVAEQRLQHASGIAAHHRRIERGSIFRQFTRRFAMCRRQRNAIERVRVGRGNESPGG